MSKRILLESHEGQWEIALTEEDRLLFFHREARGAVEAEQIYLGVVDRMIRGVEAAFIRLGQGLAGFLPFSECRARPRSGDRVLVQVKRPPSGEKAAYLTEDISLAGRYTLLTPLTERCAVSKRIEEAGDRARLLKTAVRLAPEGMGLVLRQESAGAEEDVLRAEVATHVDAWQALSALAAQREAPCLLKGREDALTRLARDEHGEIAELLTSAPEGLPPLPFPVRSCEAPFALYNVRAKLHKSLQRKIWLDCGGFLILDRTEAMTVIDVNSGKFMGSKSGTEATFLRLNQEAAREIARLLRLREIGGIVMIDFVDMQAPKSRQAVTDALRKALAEDPVKTVVHGFTALGLMELTRKKTESKGPSLPICPRCHGTGLMEETL